MKYYKSKCGNIFYADGDGKTTGVNVNLISIYDTLLYNGSMPKLIEIEASEYKEALKTVLGNLVGMNEEKPFLGDVPQGEEPKKDTGIEKIKQLNEEIVDVNLEKNTLSEKLKMMTKIAENLISRFDALEEMYFSVDSKKEKKTIVKAILKNIKYEKAKIKGIKQIETSDDLPF